MNSSAYKELLDKSEIGEDFTAADRDVIESALRLALRATDPGMVMVPQSALDWLDGSGPGPDGKWFDEDMREPKTKGMYWWRSEFRRKIAAAQEDQP